MPDYRPPDLTDHHIRRRAPGRARFACPAALLRLHRFLARFPEAPLGLGLLLVAATLTVIEPGQVWSPSPLSDTRMRAFPTRDDIEWLRLAGAALAIVGYCYRLRYKR